MEMISTQLFDPQKSLIVLMLLCVGAYIVFFLYILALRWFHQRKLQKLSESIIWEKQVILEAVDEAILTLNRKKKVTFANQKALRLFALPITLTRNISFADLKRCKNQKLWQACHEAIEKAIETKKEGASATDDFGSKHLYLKIRAVVTKDGENICLVLSDESDQQKMLDMGKEFVANASHELKTPVTIIKGFAETLSDLPEISEEMFHSILEKIIRNCERMEKLVKSLLRLTDLEQTDLTGAKKVNLVALVESCFHTLLSAYPEVRIEQLTNRDEISVMASSDLLELALSNIFKNAIKYSEPPVTIVVKLRADDGYVTMQVIDQGIGIPESDLDRIFDRFYTVDKARCRKLGGAGLGLSIVKIIIEKHGGHIWATSEEGKGSTFYIKLPLALRNSQQTRKSILIS